MRGEAGGPGLGQEEAGAGQSRTQHSSERSSTAGVQNHSRSLWSGRRACGCGWGGCQGPQHFLLGMTERPCERSLRKPQTESHQDS